jgi:hypothetical protein
MSAFAAWCAEGRRLEQGGGVILDAAVKDSEIKQTLKDEAIATEREV